MNSYQRVMNTLTGRPVDRVPVFAVLGAYGARLTGTDMRTLFSDAAAYVAGQKALQAEFGFDLVLTGLDYSALAEAFGGEVAWCGDQPPNMKRPAFGNATDALRSPLPDPAGSGRLPVILEANRRLAELYRERVPLISAIPGPGCLPALLLGMERWMELVLFEAETAESLMHHSVTFLASWANALVEAGADGLIVTEGMVAAEVVPRSMFQRQFLPHLHTLFAEVRAPKVVSSTGGSINQALDLLTGLEGVVGVIAGSKDDLTLSRQLLGPDLTLIGNLDNLALPALSPAALLEMSRELLRRAAPSGRYILANSGADVPQATPPENLRALLQAAAGYPGAMGGAS